MAASPPKAAPAFERCELSEVFTGSRLQFECCMCSLVGEAGFEPLAPSSCNFSPRPIDSFSLQELLYGSLQASLSFGVDLPPLFRHFRQPVRNCESAAIAAIRKHQDAYIPETRSRAAS